MREGVAVAEGKAGRWSKIEDEEEEKKRRRPLVAGSPCDKGKYEGL